MKKIFILVSFLSLASCGPNMETDAEKYCNKLNEFSNKVYSEIKDLKSSELMELQSKLMELQKEFFDETKDITAKYDQEEFSKYLLKNCDLNFDDIVQKALNNAQKNIDNSDVNYDNNNKPESKNKYLGEFDQYLDSLVQNRVITIPENCNEIKNTFYGIDNLNWCESYYIKDRNIRSISVTEDSVIIFDEYITDGNDLYDDVVKFIDNGGYGCDYCAGLRSPKSSDNPEKAIIVFRSFLGPSVAGANTETRILKDILSAYFMLRHKRYYELYSYNDISYKEILMTYNIENIPNKYYQRILRVNAEYPMNFLFKKGATEPDDIDYQYYNPPPPPSPPGMEGLYEEDYQSSGFKEEDIEFESSEFVEETFNEFIEAVAEVEEEEEEDTIVLIEAESKGEEEIFNFANVETLPIFPGCENLATKDEKFGCLNANIMKHISNNFEFPEIAREMGIQGKIYVNFVIDKQGRVTMVRVVRGVDEIIDNEAMRVIKSLPKFTPAEKHGKPVSMQYTVPINARLQ
jgi:protein TonB